MKISSIDIGSNSVLLLGLEKKGKEFAEIIDESRITSLGKNLDIEKCFIEESMDATLQALSDYKEILISKNFDHTETIVTATEASRVASNAKDFFDKIEKELGFKIRIITSEGEAYYTALGVSSSLTNSNNEIVILDIGGASSELIKIQLNPFKLIETISLPIGSVRATDWIAKQNVDDMWKSLKNKDQLDQFRVENLICTAGSMTSLGAVYKKQKEFNAKDLDGFKIMKQDFLNFLNSIDSNDKDSLLREYPFLGKRVNSISGGIWVARKIVEGVCENSITISTRGLRYGTAIAGGLDERYLTR